jgi:signal transduction histidine kinase
VQVIAEGGTHMGALVTFTDLESRERISTELQVSERMAQLGRITAGVAHEVKNPLNSMRLWLENLRESLPAGDDMPQQAVRVLDNEIDRLDSVVKRFLDFTRPPELNQEEASLKEILDQVLRLARPQMDKSGISLVSHIEGDVPPVLVDSQLMNQALMNLVMNAIEAMPGGGTLTATLERHGEMAEIRIADTGRGIAPENQKKIFQLFFSTRPGGSGIGLASAFRTVQLLNGSIDFTSELGRGTTFRIELPLARQAETVPPRTRDSKSAVVRNT